MQINFKKLNKALVKEEKKPKSSESSDYARFWHFGDLGQYLIDKREEHFKFAATEIKLRGIPEDFKISILHHQKWTLVCEVVYDQIYNEDRELCQLVNQLIT